MSDPEDLTEAEEITEEGEEETSEEPAAESQEVSPKKPSDEMKLVIIMKANRIMLGLQTPDCDPVYRTMEGTLAAALKKVPALVTEAKQQWEANPKYPKADLPAPPPSPTPTRTPTAARAAQPTNQPKFF